MGAQYPFPDAEAVQRLEHAYELEARDDLSEAMRACDAALALAPDWAEAHNLRGIILEAQGQQQEAVESFRRAVHLDPEDADLRENLEGAERDLEADLESDPEREAERLAEASLDRHTAWPTPLAPGEDLVTIAAYWYPLQAYIAQGRLTCEGIWSMVADDVLIQVDWLYCLALGGVKLKVKESDALAALEALEPQPVNQLWLEEQAGPDAMRCPDCGSLDIRFERLELPWVLTSWVLTGPLFIGLPWILLGGIPPSGTSSILLLILETVFFQISHIPSGFPLPFFKNRWHCDHCGGEWREEDLEEVEETMDEDMLLSDR